MIDAIVIKDDETKELVEKARIVEGDRSSAATARRLIYDGFRYRRLRDAGRLPPPESIDAPAPVREAKA